MISVSMMEMVHQLCSDKSRHEALDSHVLHSMFLVNDRICGKVFCIGFVRSSPAGIWPPPQLRVLALGGGHAALLVGLALSTVLDELQRESSANEFQDIRRASSSALLC